MQWPREKVTLKREPWVQSTSPKNGLRLFAKWWTCKSISDKNSVRYISTITCDKNETLELAQADFSLLGLPTRATGIWIEMDVHTTMQTKTEIMSDRHLAM